MVEKHPEKHAEKNAERPVTVLARLVPREQDFESAKVLFHDWCEELKKIPACNGVEVICCIPGQIAWIEHWANKATLDVFNKEHMAYSPFMARFFENSVTAPSRNIYRKLF